MQLDRRTLVAVALAVSLASAGCLGILLGDQSYEATPVTADEATANDAGYEKASTDDVTVNRTFSAADQERTVTVTNWAVEYQKTVSVGPLVDQKAAVFATFSSPEVAVLGESFNPLSKLGTKDLAKRMQNQYEGMTVGDEVKREKVSVAGKQTNVSTFEGTATFNGQEVDVFIVINEPVKHEGDYVVTMAVYPQEMEDEYDTVIELMKNLEHESDDE